MFDKLKLFVNKFQNKVMIDKIHSLINMSKMKENRDEIDIIIKNLQLDRLYLGSP